MNELVNHSTLWAYEDASGGKEPYDDFPTTLYIGSEVPPKMTPVEATDQGALASPVLVAAKNGITEMVKKILKNYPVAVMDRDKDNKNIILLAVEFRQVHVYKYMLENFSTVEGIFGKVDKDENSALHLAAMLSHSRPWSNPGAAFKMQWESKWYQYVRSSSRKINEELFSRINKNGKKPEELFIEEHASLLKDGSTWLTNISQSCSVVAGLVATVVFASASTVPGGVEQQSGFPVLSTSPVFQLFAISSLIALCFSVTSIVMFLAILTSGYEVTKTPILKRISSF
ncbi:uncharacterized protein LOC144551576 [Carex rostrata]